MTIKHQFTLFMTERDGLWLESRNIPFYFTDTRRQLSFSGLSNLLQDIANNHGTAHGFGLLDLLAKNRFWVLNRLHIAVYRFPELEETIEFCTWIQDIKASFPFRHLVLRDKNQEIVASAVSIWALIDGSTRRPARLAQSDFPIRPDVSAPCPVPQKISPIEPPFQYQKVHQILYGESDMMGHVNNVKYLEWILDYSPLNPLHVRPAAVEMNYLHEIVFPDTAIIRFQLASEWVVYASILKNSDGKEAVRAKITYQKA
jgi:medium-chain acyl-[acyl-carrier-protein] hydrolase